MVTPPASRLAARGWLERSVASCALRPHRARRSFSSGSAFASLSAQHIRLHMSSLYRNGALGSCLAETCNDLIEEEHFPQTFFDKAMAKFDLAMCCAISSHLKPDETWGPRKDPTTSGKIQADIEWYRQVDAVYTFMIKDAVLTGCAFTGQSMSRSALPLRLNVPRLKIVAVDAKSVSADLSRVSPSGSSAAAYGGVGGGFGRGGGLASSQYDGCGEGSAAAEEAEDGSERHGRASGIDAVDVMRAVGFCSCHVRRSSAAPPRQRMPMMRRMPPPAARLKTASLRQQQPQLEAAPATRCVQQYDGLGSDDDEDDEDDDEFDDGPSLAFAGGGGARSAPPHRRPHRHLHRRPHRRLLSPPRLSSRPPPPTRRRRRRTTTSLVTLSAAVLYQLCAGTARRFRRRR